MLHALKGDETSVAACIAILEAHTPEAVESVRQSTAKILAKTDPLFFTVPVDAEKMAAFWNWFAGYEANLKGLLDGEKCVASDEQERKVDYGNRTQVFNLNVKKSVRKPVLEFVFKNDADHRSTWGNIEVKKQ